MDDLGLQGLEDVADAARACVGRMPRRVAEYYTVDQVYVEALRDALDMLDKGRKMPEMEYDNGPWATVCNYDPSAVDTAGGWHFPGPDVSARDEPKKPIRIVPLGEGYLVEYGDDLADQKGFTDRVGVAEWLLGWLDFDEEIAESVRDIVAVLWDVGEVSDLLDDDAEQQRAEYNEWVEDALEVAEAAQAYVEAEGGVEVWAKLRQAVKKWRGIDSEVLVS